MPPRPPRLPHPHHRVSAVLVVHDGARWLPDVISALAAQTRPVQRLVAVDVGSVDDSPDLLEAALGPDRVVQIARTSTYADAVAAGVAHLDALITPPEQPRPRRRVGDDLPAPDPVPWLWLIHDDCAPDPDALAALLDAAVESPSAGVLGPKVRDWDDPRVLVEVGLSIDHAGRRETGLERRELDQGQHDGRSDVLAVGTAGMLVRRDVWDAVGGLDPRLPVLRDDIDFGWRVNAAGHRVVVVPGARLRHARGVFTGRRPVAATHGTPAAIDRRHSLLSLLANLPALAFVGALPRLVAGALLRALAFLLTRQLTAARDELAALWWCARHSGDLARMRAARRATRKVPPGALRPLFVGRTARLRGYLDHFADWVTGGARDPGAIDVVDDPDAELGLPPDQHRGLRIVRARPGLTAFVALTVLAVIAARSLLGDGALVGGELLPIPAGARELWSAYAASWHPVGAGTEAAASPAVAVLAALSSLALGDARLAVAALLLGAVPLAGLSAWWASRRIGVSVPVRLWASTTYAVLPFVTGAVAGGRLGAVVAIVAAPLLLASAHALVSGDPRDVGWRLPFGFGVGLAVATAFAPPMWLLAATGLLAGWAVAALTSADGTGAGALRRLVAVALALGTAIGVLLPWSTRLVTSPGVLLAGVTSSAETSTTTPTAIELLLLRPGGPAMPPTWLTVGVVLAAAAGLVRRRASVALGGWAVALGALALAMLSARGVGSLEPTYPAAGLAVAACGLLVAAATAADGALERLGRYSFGWRQPLAGVVAVAALAVPLGAGGVWVARGSDDPLRRDTAQSLPSVVLAEADRTPGMRVLWLDEGSDGRVRYTMTAARGRSLAEADIPLERVTRRVLDRLVADLSAARGSNAAEALAAFNVRYVAVPNPVPAVLAAGLDAQAGLSRVSFVAPVQLWQTLTPSGRLTMLGPGLARIAVRGEVAGRDELRLTPPVPLRSGREAARTIVPGGVPGRVLVLAERADDDWVASIDGKRLARTTVYGWAQAFGLPESGGRLELHRDNSERRNALAAQGVALVVALVLAAPPIRRRYDDDVDEPAPAVLAAVETSAARPEPVGAGNVRRVT